MFGPSAPRIGPSAPRPLYRPLSPPIVPPIGPPVGPPLGPAAPQTKVNSWDSRPKLTKPFSLPTKCSLSEFIRDIRIIHLIPGNGPNRAGPNLGSTMRPVDGSSD